MGFLSLLLGGQWEVGGGKGAGSLLFLVAVHFNPAATIDSFSSDFVFLRTSHSMTPSETLDQSTSTLSFETEVLALQSFFSRLPGANNPISFFIPPLHTQGKLHLFHSYLCTFPVTIFRLSGPPTLFD